jgi:hypothetical protein
VVDELNQISVAVGHAALAATDIHNRLDRSSHLMKAVAEERVAPQA